MRRASASSAARGGTKTPFCFGDGSGTACPCGPGAVGNGCPNSFVPGGANLFASGSASTTADTLVLFASNMPPNVNCTFFQGTTQAGGGAGTLFGDGLRCATGTVIRLGSKLDDSTGASSYPQAGEEVISLIYSLSDHTNTREAPEGWRFSKLQEQWLYDEVDLMNDQRGPFVHRILLSTGVSLEIPFVSVIIHRFTVPLLTKMAKQSA